MMQQDLIIKVEQLKPIMEREQVENYLYSLGYDFLSIKMATDFSYQTHSPMKGSLKISSLVIWLFIVGLILSWGFSL